MNFFNSVKALYAAVGILVLTIGLGSYVDIRNEEMHLRHRDITTGLERMVRLNQELTSMLLIAALEQSTLRTASYDTIENSLNETIKTVVGLTGNHSLSQEIAALQEGRVALHTIEEKALQLMRADRWREARGLLFGDDYVRARKTYEIDSETAVGTVTGELATTAQQFGRIRSAALGIRVGALLLLVWIGIMFSRRTRADLAEQVRLRTELADSHRVLEERVLARTAELSASEQKIRRILATASEGFWLMDNEAVTADVNDAMCRILGRSRSEIVGRPVSGVVDGENLRILTGAIARQSGSCELSLVRPDGGQVVCLFSTSPLLDEEGTITGSFAMCSDITERKRIEEYLTASERLSRLILNSTAEGILGVDADVRVTFLNDAAAAMTGFTADELVGRSLHEMIHHSYADGSPYPLEACPMQQACCNGEKLTTSGELFWRKDGSAFPVEYSVTPIAGEQGGGGGAVVVFRDIAARVSYEDELCRRMEELERFNRFAMDREERMIRLKQEVNQLLGELGRDRKYRPMTGEQDNGFHS